MKVNQIQKVILLLTIIVTFVQCVIFVPQSIKVTYYSAQNVPHSVIVRTLYKPIWYDHVEPWYDYEARKEVENYNDYRNFIDWQRLSIQLFASFVILGCSFLITNSYK